MATKKIKQNIDPGRPVSRPMAPPAKDTNWGKTLTKTEWKRLMNKLDAKKKEREMSKLSDTLARALAKKQGRVHTEPGEVTVTPAETKKKIKPTAPAGKKPPTRSAGRGR